LVDVLGPSASLRSRTVTGSAWTLGSVLAGAPVGLVCTVLAARSLGAAGFGRYALLIFVATFASAFSDLGLTSVLQRRVAVAFGRDDHETQISASQEAFLLTAFRMTVVTLVCFVFVHDFFALGLIALSAVVQTLPSSATVLLTGTSRSALMAKTGLACNVLGYVTLVVVSSVTHQADLTFGAFLVAATAPHLLLLGKTGLPIRDLLRLPVLRPSRSEWRFALLGFANGQLAALVFSRSELLFFPGGRHVERGGFAAATTVGSRVTLAIDSLFGPVPLALAAVYGRGPTAYQKSLTVLFRLSATFFALTFPLLSVLAVTVAPYLFSRDFGDLRLPILILVIVSLLQTSAQPATAAWLAEGTAGPLLLAALVAGALDVIGSALLIPRYGINGAVVCNAGAALIYLVWLFVAFRGRLLGGEYARYLLIVVGSAALGAVLAFGASASAVPQPLTGIVLMVAAAILGMLVVRWSRILGEREIETLTTMAPGSRLARLTRLAERPLRSVSTDSQGKTS
jgi:O-antigen/teichoic acid export membrane protein